MTAGGAPGLAAFARPGMKRNYPSDPIKLSSVSDFQE